MQLITQSKAT